MSTVMQVEICWFVFSNLLIEQRTSVWCKCSDDSASAVVVWRRMKRQKGSGYGLYWQKDKCFPCGSLKTLLPRLGNWKLRFFWALPSRSSDVLFVVCVLSCLSPRDPREPDGRRVTRLTKSFSHQAPSGTEKDPGRGQHGTKAVS